MQNATIPRRGKCTAIARLARRTASVYTDDEGVFSFERRVCIYMLEKDNDDSCGYIFMKINYIDSPT